MEKVIIYTDGACSGNPGPGGWGTILMYNGNKKEISGAKNNTTNNVMELTAALEGLKMLKFPCEVELYSDSAYLVNSFSQGWIYNWKKNNWKTASKEPVKNKEIWEEIYNLTQIHKVKFIKVKGHADNEFNNRCDEMARNAIKTL
jgi:ribonuclease HI